MLGHFRIADIPTDSGCWSIFGIYRPFALFRPLNPPHCGVPLHLAVRIQTRGPHRETAPRNVHFPSLDTELYKTSMKMAGSLVMRISRAIKNLFSLPP
jgi:hypothetical protein